MEMYTNLLLGGFASSIPPLLGWIITIVLAARMLRRGGARAERFLLAGASVMLVQTIITIWIPVLIPWLIDAMEKTAVEAASVFSALYFARGCIGLAGIFCLVYAFWVKFNQAKSMKG